jgi:hypothetical protein
LAGHEGSGQRLDDPVLAVFKVPNLGDAHGRVVAAHDAQAFALTQRIDNNTRSFHNGRASHVQVAHWHRLLETAVLFAQEQPEHGTVGVFCSVEISGLCSGQVD